MKNIEVRYAPNLEVFNGDVYSKYIHTYKYICKKFDTHLYTHTYLSVHTHAVYDICNSELESIIIFLRTHVYLEVTLEVMLTTNNYTCVGNYPYIRKTT